MTKIWTLKTANLVGARVADPRGLALIPLGLAVTGLALSFGVAPALSATARAVTHSSGSSPTCPSAQCPYTAPTSTESGFAGDVLTRMNIERAQPARDYVDEGVTTQLVPLSSDSVLQETAQSFAEYLASTGTLENYSGANPSGRFTTAGNAGGPVYDSATVDAEVMGSYGHAVGYLSAAADLVGVGVAFDAQGRAWVDELFGGTTEEGSGAGQQRITAELASNSVYAQSGGTITTVTEPAYAGGGTDNAQDVFPTDPIAAASTFATGVDWTSSGPIYPSATPGSVPVSPLPAPVTDMAATRTGGGYLLVDAAGAISVHGDAQFYGGANGFALDQPIERIVMTSDGGGYWLVSSDGGVFSFGDAQFYGSMGGKTLNAPVVDLAPTSDGGGYWLVASDGGVFAFGDARFQGSTGGIHLNAPVVGITAAGGGYRLVASDGGVFSFGAPFYGSTGSLVLNRPIVAMTNSASGGGYYLVASDGGIFSFGTAPFEGSTGAIVLNRPIVGLAVDDATGGYWLVASDGGIFSFDAPFFGAD
jgi:uncharacterized protein YkwD